MAQAIPNLPPLAEYFWIAGIDSISYGEHLPPEPPRRSFPEGLIETAEPEESEENPYQRRSNGTLQPASRSASPNRLSPLQNTIPTTSGEGRLSVTSQNNSGNLSNLRSSNSSTSTLAASLKVGMSDADFDKALFKFAAERESFLEDLSFSAGTIVNNKPVVHPRAQKVINDDHYLHKAGSLRRRISLRDLSSMRRAPSVVGRAASIRTSRRMSNYNSVIPVPQPLSMPPNMHPLKRKFEPVLLDRYPPRSMVEETKKRGPFPDYVPMFAFPNDVNIVSSDERPRSTWHGFTMTGGDNAQLHGICVTIWIPLNPRAAEDLERRCEEWRRDNMTNEERELASSLGERLAAERAKLSRLLAKLPTTAASAREALDEEIVETEERISLMADLLRPVRHGAASKIEGLTDGDTGLWIPRAFGILGKDTSLMSFWKEWLKAIVVPMIGNVQRVPPSSQSVGVWLPLERYVVNLCAEAPAPEGSKTQVEIALRELRLYARKEAINEIPGSRNIDLYALFRSMSLQNVVTMFEFALSESRIILLSSHTAMLHSASRTLISLLYPLTWSGIFIPVLPARLLSAIEAPCPYIVGIERRYEKIELPEEDFVLVDLDSDSILSSNPPTLLPKAQRRKLVSLLQLAAGHHNRCGVPVGPPQYVIETFPNDCMVSENTSVYSAIPPPSTLAKFASLNSASFGGAGSSNFAPKPPVFNAFSYSQKYNRNYERPNTSGTIRGNSPPSPRSPIHSTYPPTTGSTGLPRQDSGFTLTATLRGKRSGNLDSSSTSRRSSSVSARFPHRNPGRGDHLLSGTKKFGFERTPTLRRPSVPFTSHSPSPSTSSLTDSQSIFNQYPPSVYSPSTLAASTIMPNILMQPVRNTDTVRWVEGHCLNWKANDVDTVCSICEEKSDEGIYTCSNCPVGAHMRCAPTICLPCPIAFYPDQIRAAFVRCFASLFYTYRRFLMPATGDGKKAGKLYKFNMEAFLKSMPHECADYVRTLEQTQAFNEFIHDRETKKPTAPDVLLFDQIILSKKNRGKTSFFSSKGSTTFLCDTSEHLWRTSAAISPQSTVRIAGETNLPPNRVPAKLDPTLLREPRVNQGVPKMPTAKPKRKPSPSTTIPIITKNQC